MSSSVVLPALKAWQLKYWAFLTGIASSGTKAQLQDALTRNLNRAALSIPQRIASVDMGIRNLAYCVVEPRQLGTAPITVTTWKRMDLLSSGGHVAGSSSGLELGIDDAEMREDGNSTVQAKDTFTPKVLSKTAYEVVSALLRHNPTNILIERQRFRSGGAAAIQEWTVRVNMLESMLWASLETVKAERGAALEGVEVRAINPASVAKFWTAAEHVPLRASEELLTADIDLQTLLETPSKTTTTRSKVTKQDKMAIVKSWIRGVSDVSLAFEGDTRNLAEALVAEKGGKRAREVAGGKLDDLADCLLQAATVVRWEENRQVIRKMLKKLD